LLHNSGPALWPGHKPLAEVLELKATTPPGIWSGTYQGWPTPPGGQVFQRAWWRDNRFDASDRRLIASCIGRWQSWDTALKDKESSDYAACVIGELWPDYRLVARHVYRARLPFPDLPEQMEALAKQFNRDEKLRGIIIEDKVSGTSAYQTLMAQAAPGIRKLLIAFMPTGDKVQRAEQAAVWCKNGSVLLPAPSAGAPWLVDFEDELFTFPAAANDDQVDAFSQLIIYIENLLAEGFHARHEFA